MQSGIITKSRSKPRNLLSGLIGTPDTFDTPPSDIAKATDGDFTTATGEGTKTRGGGGTVGQIVYDLKKNTTLLISSKLDLYASTGSMNLIVDVSDDENNWINGPGYAYSVTKTGSGVYFQTSPYICNGRYVRFRFSSGGAANPAVVKIYQLMAYEVGV